MSSGRWRRKGYRLVMAVSLICAVSGCGGAVDEAEAKEELSWALAGLAGSDAVTFEGAAALMLDGQTDARHSLYFGGSLEEHSRLSMYTLLPDEQGGGRLAQASVRTASAAPLYVNLKKTDGKWTGSAMEAEERRLAGFNPFKKLEELGAMKELKVAEEAGAGRGLRVLRVELPPEQARLTMKRELEAEMEGVLAAAKAGRNSLEPQLEALWKRERDHLSQRLEASEVGLVYHLTVDKKRNLPQRLTMRRTVVSPGGEAEEALVSEIDFYGYR